MLTKFISVSETRFQNIETTLKNQQASIQGLETQISQLTKLISERPLGSLLSHTKSNPREQLNVITIQDEEGLVEPEPELRQGIVVSKGKSEVDHSEQKLVSKEYKPRVPYPIATRKDRTDEQFGKFLKLLKKLHINLSFIEALSKMPNAVKFLKELLANKRKLDEASHVELNAGTRLKSTHDPCSSNNKEPIYEERRLQIEELDEWRTHKLRRHDKPKPRHDELNISPNQLKVGDKVLLDAADPCIATSEPNGAISLTVLSIFPYGTFEVIHPKFGTFKVLHDYHVLPDHHNNLFAGHCGYGTQPLPPPEYPLPISSPPWLIILHNSNSRIPFII
ncbi:hypothetical protein GOBAR_AA26438 [Gossypium barbadense]|uniref:Uncharacterized protein n=1 Tax=Gossypium barbadense TaxID=3634 RepID=A0A2P5WT26_GOSBA|nr:hypothetical protein GOBAR_AA26438 [Gossypium barbadense]